MKCTNCGGEMDLVSNRDYFVCPFCLSFHFPETKPITDDGVRLLGAPPTELSCPVCAGQRLVPASVDRSPVLACTRCRGVLLSSGALFNLVAIRRSNPDRYRGPAVPIDPRELTRVVACPQCEHRMDTAPYLGPGNVVIDSCGGCTLVWLDHGELAVIERHPS